MTRVEGYILERVETAKENLEKELASLKLRHTSPGERPITKTELAFVGFYTNELQKWVNELELQAVS